MKQLYTAPVIERFEVAEEFCASISVGQWDDLTPDEE